MTNGQERNVDAFRRLSCYITQDDRLQSVLTVSENMQIAADLKLGEQVTRQEKNGIVSTISMLFCGSVKTLLLALGKNKHRVKIRPRILTSSFFGMS
jgi:ABC-type multidrug transport system ATPase subunit